MCAGCHFQPVPWFQSFLGLEDGAETLLFWKPNWYTSGEAPFHSGIGNVSPYATRLPPPTPVDVASVSALVSSACNPPMPVGVLRESACVSAACMPPPVPLCEDNLVQLSSVVMSFPMELELELETALSHPTPCDSSTAWIYRPHSISDVKAAAYAGEWDNSDRMMQERERVLSVHWPFWGPIFTFLWLGSPFMLPYKYKLVVRRTMPERGRYT